MTIFTVEEIKRSYEQKKHWEKQFPVSYYLFRPLSFPLTAFLSRFTNSPQLLAWLGLGIGTAACVALVFRGPFGAWPGLAGLTAFALLDATDGNMARATASVNRYGKLLDGALGKLVEGAYLPALSAGLYFHGDGTGFPWGSPPYWVLLSGFIALLALLYSSYMESAYDALSSGSAPKTDLNARVGSSRFRGNPFYAVFINLHAFNLQLVLLFIAVLSHNEPAFLAFICAYYLVRLAVIYPYYLIKGRTELG